MVFVTDDGTEFLFVSWYTTWRSSGRLGSVDNVAVRRLAGCGRAVETVDLHETDG